MRVLAPAVLAVMSLVLGILGCGSEKNAPPPQATALTPGEPADTAAYYHLRTSDGLVTWNTRCPIRLGKVHARMKPLYVNGRPVGFC